MRIHLPGSRLRRALLRPEPTLALLLFLCALVYLLWGGQRERPPLAHVEISAAEQADGEAFDVRLVRFDEAGLELPTFVSISLPEDPPGRVRAILAALRESLGDDRWPRSLPVPTVFVETVSRQTVAILDFRPEEPLALDVEGERLLLRSVEETLLVNGVDGIRFLLRGEGRGVFLEHLAVPQEL